MESGTQTLFYVTISALQLPVSLHKHNITQYHDSVSQHVKESRKTWQPVRLTVPVTLALTTLTRFLRTGLRH